MDGNTAIATPQHAVLSQGAVPAADSWRRRRSGGFARHPQRQRQRQRIHRPGSPRGVVQRFRRGGHSGKGQPGDRWSAGQQAPLVGGTAGGRWRWRSGCTAYRAYQGLDTTARILECLGLSVKGEEHCVVGWVVPAIEPDAEEGRMAQCKSILTARVRKPKPRRRSVPCGRHAAYDRMNHRLGQGHCRDADWVAGAPAVIGKAAGHPDARLRVMTGIPIREPAASGRLEQRQWSAQHQT